MTDYREKYESTSKRLQKMIQLNSELQRKNNVLERKLDKTLERVRQFNSDIKQL